MGLARTPNHEAQFGHWITSCTLLEIRGEPAWIVIKAFGMLSKSPGSFVIFRHFVWECHRYRDAIPSPNPGSDKIDKYKRWTSEPTHVIVNHLPRTSLPTTGLEDIPADLTALWTFIAWS